MESQDLEVTKTLSSRDAFLKRLFILWFVLLIPWLPFALLSGMAFDGGPTFEAYFFVTIMWTYPLAIVVASIGWVVGARRFAFLPLVNLAAFVFCWVWPWSRH